MSSQRSSSRPAWHGSILRKPSSGLHQRAKPPEQHEIRRLLNKYYEEAGHGGLIRLDLPSGHYVPVFRRSTPDESAPDTPTALANEEAPAPNRVHLGITLVLGALCLALASLLVVSWKNGSAVQSRGHAPS